MTCDSCNARHELCQPITANLPTKCVGCGSQSPDYHQAFNEYNYTMLCYGNIDTVTTVGQAAELNAKRIGKERMDTLYPPRTKPGLDLRKVKDVRRYIETGEK